MKAYILKDRDFDRLLANVDRDARVGHNGGSSVALTPEEQRAHEAAHKFFNYQVRTWIDQIRTRD